MVTEKQLLYAGLVGAGAYLFIPAWRNFINGIFGGIKGQGMREPSPNNPGYMERPHAMHSMHMLNSRMQLVPVQYGMWQER